MSILRTYNVQNPDSASVNVELSANGGIRVAGLSTFSGELRVGTGVTISGGIVTATSLSGNVTGNVTGNVSGNVNSTGVSTFATANITQSNPTNLNVSGVSTFAGITTVTGPTLFAKQLNVSGVTTATSFVGNITGNVTGNINSTGVSTITTLSATSIVGVSTAGITTAYIGSVNNGPISGFKNLIINGGFDIWQRGTSFSTNAAYTADRWWLVNDSVGTTAVTRQDISSQGLGSQYCLRAERSAGTNRWVVGTQLETITLKSVLGKTITLSFYLRKGSALTSDITATVATSSTEEKFGSNVDSTFITVSNSSINTSTFTKFFVTLNIPASSSALGIKIEFNASQTGASNAYFELAQVQLEEGPVASVFERRPYGQELALCYRYFQNIGSTVFHCWGHRVADTEGIRSQVFTYLTPMRGAPTLSFDDGAGNSSKVAIESPARDLSTNVSFSFNQKYWGWDNGFKYPYGLTGFSNGVSGIMNVYNLKLSSEL